MFTTVLLASMVGLSAALVNNELPLGTGMVFKLDTKDINDICPIKIVVPENRAGDKCKIQFDTWSKGLMGVNVDFWWKKDSPDFDPTNDKLTHAAGSSNLVAEVDCKTAGTYYLGIKERKCDTCKLGIKAEVQITATLNIDGVFTIDAPKTGQFRSTHFKTAEDEFVLIYFNMENPGTPHIDIDRCATCLTDAFEVWIAKEAEWSDETKRTKMIGETSLTFKQKLDAAGDYIIGVKLTSAITTGKTQFEIEYAVNEEPDAQHPAGVCPTNDCSTAELAECGICTNENCHWCDKSLTCTNKSCASLGEGEGDAEAEVEILKNDKCPDANALCDEFKDCEACAKSGRCIWCDSGSKVSGGLLKTGSCTAGKANLRKECTSAVASGITKAEECPGAGTPANSSASLIVSLATLFVVFAALF